MGTNGRKMNVHLQSTLTPTHTTSNKFVITNSSHPLAFATVRSGSRERNQRDEDPEGEGGNGRERE